MGGALTWARLGYRFQRRELMLLALAVVGASAVMLWLSLQLSGLTAANPGCDLYLGDLACPIPAQQFLELSSPAYSFLNNTWFAGLGVGLFLGVPVVAREVDHGTAQLAWTMDRSRTRWLLQRVAFVVLAAGILLAVLAIATELLAAAVVPDADLSRDFFLYGGRGPLVVARALLGLAIGVLVGSLVGRQLPALLLGGIAVGMLYAGVTFALDRWSESEAEVMGIAEMTDVMGAKFLTSGIELTGGERVSWGDPRMPLEAYSPGDGYLYASQADADVGRDPIGREYQLLIPGERYPELVAREAAVLGAASLLLVGASAVVTERRRPV